MAKSNKKRITLKYKPHPRQLEAHQASENYILFGGSLCGGKSVWLVNDMLQYCLDYADNRVGIFRWENSTFADTTMKTIEEWILNVPGLVPKGGHNKTKRSIKLFNGSEIIYGGLKPSSSSGGDILARVKSLELSAAGVDEASEMPEKVWNFLCGRIPRWKAKDLKTGKRVYPPKRVICTSNPEICWVKSKFIDQKLPNYRFIQSLTTDNPHQSADYIESLKEAFTESELERYLEGRWDAVRNYESIFPPEWVRGAMERDLPEDSNDISFGVDVATHGDDQSVIYKRMGSKITYIDNTKKLGVVDVADVVARYADIHHPHEIVIDAIGVGEGVCDILFNQGYNVIPFIGGSTAYEEGYANRRAEAYWNLRMALQDGRVDIPIADHQLENELCSVNYTRGASDRYIQIESKRDIKKRIGRSPDLADAVVYSFAEKGAGYLICANI